MKILFSPSEDKHLIKDDTSTTNPVPFGFLKDLLFGNELESTRLKFASAYKRFLETASNAEIMKLFGITLNNSNNIDILVSCANLDISKCVESILLYSGVAYKALNIAALPQNAKDFLYENVIIFSNLFGAIMAKDNIPYYKLKQGERFGNYNINALYRHFKKPLDDLLEGEEIIDLRAEYYIKAYMPPFPHTKVEFYKNGKKLSHTQKHYRGLLLRDIALHKRFDPPFTLINTKQDKYTRILQYDITE